VQTEGYEQSFAGHMPVRKTTVVPHVRFSELICEIFSNRLRRAEALRQAGKPGPTKCSVNRDWVEQGLG
jgi:hypothetical protein